MHEGLKEGLIKQELMGEILTETFLEAHNPEDTESYYRRKVDSVSSGKPTWMVRNFEAELGRIYDFFKDQRHWGFVEDDSTRLGYSAYVDGDEGWQFLNEGDLTMSLDKAITAVQYWVKRTNR